MYATCVRIWPSYMHTPQLRCFLQKLSGGHMCTHVLYFDPPLRMLYFFRTDLLFCSLCAVTLRSKRSVSYISSFCCGSAFCVVWRCCSWALAGDLYSRAFVWRVELGRTIHHGGFLQGARQILLLLSVVAFYCHCHFLLSVHITLPDNAFVGNVHACCFCCCYRIIFLMYWRWAMWSSNWCLF